MEAGAGKFEAGATALFLLRRLFFNFKSFLLNLSSNKIENVLEKVRIAISFRKLKIELPKGNREPEPNDSKKVSSAKWRL